MIFTEKKLSKLIIYSFILLMTSMIFAISYFYVKNSYDDFEHRVNNYKIQYYQDKKRNLKRELDTIIDIINYNFAKDDKSENESKNDAIRLFNNIRFEKNKSNYYFVYELKDMNGGDNFAKLLVNPNRIDLVGRDVSTNYKDENGKEFRQEFLNKIKLKNEAFVQYTYKKPNTNEKKDKLSYFKLYEPWNWIIAVGVYLDDIESEVLKKKEILKKQIREQIVQNVILFIMFLSIAILISIFFAKKIDNILEEYQKKVLKKEKQLKELNENLEKRVEIEIEKNREKEQFLIQKSKFIALGEMISNIAHQWRQPLCELSAILMFIKFKYSINALDEKTMDEKSKEADTLIEFMSETIENFRTFFMPKKQEEEFFLYKTVDVVMTIVSSTLESNNIKVLINIDKSIKLKSYLNQYEQVVLNIINNAKDVLIEKKIDKPYIKIESVIDDKNVKLTIEDNAKGVSVKPKSKIFEPYFTTKQDSEGMGIGLYMSKIIVEKNMKGRLEVENTKSGAKFSIITSKKE